MQFSVVYMEVALNTPLVYILFATLFGVTVLTSIGLQLNPFIRAKMTSMLAGIASANTKTIFKVVLTTLYSLETNNSMRQEMICGFILLPISACVQFHLLNCAIRSTSIIICTPIYLTTAILFTMLWGAIVFGDMQYLTTHGQLDIFSLATVGIVLGVFTLNTPKSSHSTQLVHVSNTENTEMSMSSHRILTDGDEYESEQKLEYMGQYTHQYVHQTRHRILTHAIGEYILLQHYMFELIACFIAIGTAIVLRRLAYLRHVPMFMYMSEAINVSIDDSHVYANADHFRLHDVLFEILPDMSKNPLCPVIGDILSATCLMLSTYPLAIGVLCQQHEQHEKQVFIVSIFVRMMRSLAILELMRPLFYIWTSLPAPDINCITHNETQWKPKSILEIFSTGIMVQGCGDLIFSGHVTSNMIGLLVNFFYMDRVYESRHKICIRIYFVLITMIAVTDGVVIIMARHHYTVDVLSATIICILVWLSVIRQTKDVHPTETRCFVDCKRSSNLPDDVVLDMYASVNNKQATLGVLIMVAICALAAMSYITIIILILYRSHLL
jgi:hypothetical protein